MSFHQPCVAVIDQGVTESWNIYTVPCLAEYDIAQQHLVFKGRPITAVWCSLFNRLLNLASNSRDCPDLGALELRNLELAVEHAFDKGCIFVDFERFSNEFKLLHDVKLRVELHNDTSDTDSEVGYILTVLILDLLDTNESGADCISRCKEHSIAVTKLRSVLNHPHSLVLVLSCVDRLGLELAPAHREYKRVLVFQDMRVPSVLLNLYPNEGIVQLLVS